MFTVNGFSKFIDEKGGTWQSEPFYSHTGGFKLMLAISVYQKSESSQPHLSAQLEVIDYGKYAKFGTDGQPEISMLFAARLRILSQIKGCEHHEVTCRVHSMQSSPPKRVFPVSKKFIQLPLPKQYLNVSEDSVKMELTITRRIYFGD